MNNAFSIKKKKGVLPGLLRFFNPRHGVRVYLATFNKIILENSISVHWAPVDKIMPFYFEDISFFYEIDSKMYEITKYRMPYRAVNN